MTILDLEKFDIFSKNSNLEHFKHYPLTKAHKLYEKSLKKKYIVKTINWTFADNNDEKVHKNKYILTGEALEIWGYVHHEVAENIISVRPKIL